MKKILAMLMALAMLCSATACSAPADTAEDSTPEVTATPEPETDVKVGIVCFADENDQGYTYNIMRGATVAEKELAEDGINVEFVAKYNIGYDAACETAIIELAEEDCDIIICSSYGHEAYMLKLAGDYPDIEFIGLTSEVSAKDELENTHNAYADIFEGHYIAGVVAGMQFKQMIRDGEVTEDELLIGAVAPFAIPEVISGYTAFYLGAKMACPTVKMNVIYTSSWVDATAEAEAAQTLIDGGAILISQHTDTTAPATVAEENGIWHCGYNTDMTEIAPTTSLISTYINWGAYYEYAVRAVYNGEEIAQDWTGDIDNGAVILTPLNLEIATEYTPQTIDNVVEAFFYGSVGVFDGPWTGTGTAFGADAPDTKTVEAGETFLESDVANGLPSAPYFYWIIDGITELN